MTFFLRPLATFATVMLLASCGGGGGSSDGGGTSSQPTDDQRLDAALLSGDPGALKASQGATLLARATTLATQLDARQATTLGALYGSGTTAVDLSLNLTTNSISISPLNAAQATAFIRADNGNGLAALSERGSGRALAYGANVLDWMAGTTREQQHLPLFKRAFAWVMTGSATGAVPATLKFAVGGYSAASVKAFATRAGAAATEVSCTIAVENTCWQDADLLVFGASVTNDSGLKARVASYLAAGKPVLYLHGSWGNSDGGRKVLAAMGMQMGGYPGNYFADATGVSVAAGRTAEASLTTARGLAALVDALKKLADDGLVLDVATNTAPTDAVTAVHTELAAFHANGLDVFQETGAELYRLLVLWADLYRPGIAYGQIDKAASPATFLRTYASDSWLAFNRATTTTATAGQGDYMPASAQQLAVGDWEDIDVTVAQASGITLIGRGAVPAKGVQIQVLDAAGATALGVQTSHVRTWGNPLTDANYPRPRRPHSFNVPLGSGTTVFSTPFGGPLMLSYSGATAGTTVKLRVRGAAKYAHFDFTRTMSEADLADAVAALKRADFGWQTDKLVGGEIQQITKYAQAAIGTLDPKVYVVDRLKGILFDTNHIANGYRNMPMTTAVSSLCTGFGWDCDGTVHAAPGVQHFVGWIATCGYLCSGNPSDGYAGIDIGWGWAHELGHNTVQRVMHIVPDGKGCTTECDNNILAGTQMLRKYALLGEDTNGSNFNHPLLYATVLASRATALTGEALRADMQQRLWTDGSDNAKQALHYQLAFLYTRHRRGLAQPTMESAIDFITLLTKADRLVAKSFDAATASKYGMGRYTTNTLENHDLLYVLSSKIVGRDLKDVFAMYGLALTATSLGSVADLGLPTAPLDFYALPAGKSNQLAPGKWVSLQGQSPAYPF